MDQLGLSLLFSSILFFTVAFAAAGLVTSRFSRRLPVIQAAEVRQSHCAPWPSMTWSTSHCGPYMLSHVSCDSALVRDNVTCSTATFSAVVRIACLTYLALHAGGFKASQQQCGAMPRDYGGMPCVPSTQAGTDIFKMLLPLNTMSGDCFAVWGVAQGSHIHDSLVDGSTDFSPVQYNNDSSFNLDSDFNANFTRDACYLKIMDINSTNPDQHLSNTKIILCTAGLVPNGYDYWGHPKQGVDPQAAGRVGYQDALVNMTTAGNFWFSGRTAPQNGSLNTWYYMILGTSVPGTWFPFNANSGCACSDSMIQEWEDGNLMFVTYTPPGHPRGVYAASLVNESHPHFVEFPKTARGRFYNL